METNKAIEIYLPNNTDSLNKDLLEKQSAISKILCETPFEKDINAIFEHLVKVQGAMHYSGEKEERRTAKAKEDLNLINTIMVLFHSHSDAPKLKSEVIKQSTIIPEEIIAAMKNVAKELYDKNLSLCLKNVVKYKKKDVIKNGIIIIEPIEKGEEVYKDKADKDYCEKVIIGEYRPITDYKHIRDQWDRLKKIKGYAGKKTIKKETPHIITDTFRMVCAIKVFCNCKGFYEWGKRGNAMRNECIFKCLQVFGYTTIQNTTDAMEQADRRNYEKKRVNDAEKSNIVFISPPL